MSILTVDVLRESFRKMIDDDPLEKFACENGFSLLAGDKLVLPNSMEKEFGKDHRIIYSFFTKDVYLISPRRVGIGLNY